MTDQQHPRPTPGFPVVSIASIREKRNVKLYRSGPRGAVRPVVGPYSPLCGSAHAALPLTYTLKVIEPHSCRVVSTTRLAGPEEASTALRLLGPNQLQAVLLSGSMIEFLPRTQLKSEAILPFSG